MTETLKSIMARVFKTDEANITENLEQRNVKFWDSLRHLNLIVELEEHYGVSFEPEEIAEMITFNKVIYYINQKLGK
jgi:acyl carrier protein